MENYSPTKKLVGEVTWGNDGNMKVFEFGESEFVDVVFGQATFCLFG